MVKTKKSVFDRIPNKIKGEKRKKQENIKNKSFKKDLNQGIRYYKKLGNENEREIKNQIRILKKYKRKLYTWPSLKKSAIVGITLAAIGFGSHTFYTAYSRNDFNPKDKIETYYPVLEEKLTELKEKYSKLLDETDIKSTIIEKKDDTIEYLKSYKRSLEERVIQKPPIIVNKPAPVQKQSHVPVMRNKNYYYFPVRGDTLSEIAWMVSGDMNNWHRIQEYNDLSSDLIEVNQVLKIPSDIISDPSRLYHGNLDCKVYYAENGDNLRTISQKLYGDSDHADDIYRFNKRFNPYFSSKIWNNEWILVPKDS